MDKARMNEIRQRAEAATPAPWEDTVDDHGELGIWLTDPYAPADGPVENRYKWIYLGDVETTDKYDHADAAFIAHARTDVPALLDALREAEARVSELEKAGMTVVLGQVRSDSDMSGLDMQDWVWIAKRRIDELSDVLTQQPTPPQEAQA